MLVRDYTRLNQQFTTIIPGRRCGETTIKETVEVEVILSKHRLEVDYLIVIMR